MKKDDLPAMPFYWGEWFKAMDVQSLSRETKCVWFEMLGRMWESNDRGFLTINGKPMDDFAKARALGFGSDVASYLLHEKILDDAKIFSRRKDDGAIYSRFILKIVELRKKRQEAGSKGGSKTQANAKANGQAKCENENENKDEKENINNKEAFEKFWNLYPKRNGKKVGKKETYNKFKKLKQEDVKLLMIATKNYSQSKAAKENYAKDPVRFLKNDWWKDWLTPEEKQNKKLPFEVPEWVRKKKS